MYFIGIEGGGRKTHCVIGDEEGNIFAEGFGGAANYDCNGLEQAQSSIKVAVERALNKLSIQMNSITYAVLGLAGADYPEDFDQLYAMCKPIFDQVPFTIFNDCYIAFKADEGEGHGIVTVCDRGHGVLGKAKNGEVISFKNMDYYLGNRGGGDELVREALHYAFRAEDGVIASTKLQQEIPKLFHVETMREVDELIRNNRLTEDIKVQLPCSVVKLAKQRDKIAQTLVINMGRAMGQSAATMIRKIEAQDEVVSIILSGSMFVLDCPLLLDAYMLEVHKVAPYAQARLLNKKPAVGAHRLAVEEFNRSKQGLY